MPPLAGVRVRKFGFVLQNNLARVRRAAPNFTAILAHDAWRQAVFDLRNEANLGHLYGHADVIGAAIMVARIASGEIEGAKRKFYLDCFDR